MDKSDLQEVLTALYLRLNGYLASGYIAHAHVGNLTEIDIIAVRFPGHKEPEREVSPCKYLRPPSDRIDLPPPPGPATRVRDGLPRGTVGPPVQGTRCALQRPVASKRWHGR